MSALEKLLIRGIRSFDDKQASVIEFYSPVTVIVGHNGSGKTVSFLLFRSLCLNLNLSPPRLQPAHRLSLSV